MNEQLELVIRSIKDEYQNCLESRERVRAAMEETLLENEELELKNKKLQEENDELKQKIFVMEQMLRERKWSEWTKCEG